MRRGEEPFSGLLDPDALFLQGHMEGQQMIRGQVALRSMGIGGIPVVNVENACASGSSAVP